MGRVKLKIKKLENTNGRQTTFAKRRNGILKKANELSILCDIDIVLLMFSPAGKPSLCCGRRSSIEEVIAKFSQVTPPERTKRKFESLEVLKKTFQKLDHNVNIREFNFIKNRIFQDLSTQSRFLQARISEIHGRLSYWTKPDKINNVELLGQLEISIKQSLDQLRAHKVTLCLEPNLLHFICQTKNSKNFMQDGIQIPLEQQLQSMSWILNSNTNNIVTEEHNSIPRREVECSASSSFGSYPGYFGTGKAHEITVSGQEASFLDELNGGQLKPQANSPQQFANNNNVAYNPNQQIDLNHHQTLPLSNPQVYNFPMNQREYHMNGFFEPPPPPESSGYDNNNTNQTRFGSSSSSLHCSASMLDEILFSQVRRKDT
ncbi:unnamed protein product [Cochlearia groenlandica]